MRHRKSAGNFGRPAAHRRAMIANLVCSLFEHGRVVTSPQKAKAARPIAERMITLGKRGTLAARRLALRRLRHKPTVKKLFARIAPLFADRSGGYTRILRLPRTIRVPSTETSAEWRRAQGLRLNDGGEQCYFELVGYQPPVIEKKPKGKAAAAESDAAGKGGK